MFGGKPFVSGSVQCAPDDLFLLVTDGVLEVTNAEDEEFGLAGVKAVMSAQASNPPSAILQAVLDATNRHVTRLTTSLCYLFNATFAPPDTDMEWQKTADLLCFTPPVRHTWKSPIFIVDPYVDEQIVDTYLTAAAQPVTVRLLARESTAALGPAVTKFIAQTKMKVEIRRSEAIHDRVIFLDGRSCWVLGQSIKNAAKSKTTYLASLDSDAAGLKNIIYEQCGPKRN
jgi:hypothetical protein